MWYLRHCYHPVADKGGGHGMVGRGGDDSALARVAATLAPRRRLQSEPSITRGGFARASPAKVRLLFEERERDSVLAIPPRFQPLFHATPRNTPRNNRPTVSSKRRAKYEKKRKEEGKKSQRIVSDVLWSPDERRIQRTWADTVKQHDRRTCEEDGKISGKRIRILEEEYKVKTTGENICVLEGINETCWRKNASDCFRDSNAVNCHDFVNTSINAGFVYPSFIGESSSHSCSVAWNREISGIFVFIRAHVP